MSTPSIRPRLALVVATPREGGVTVEALERALSGGDVATVFIGAAGRDPASFQAHAEALVPVAQAAGAAAIVVDDTRCAGRVGADGLHLSHGSVEELRDAVERFAPKLIVGASGFRTRHDALVAGEAMPDYLFFGRLSAAPAAAADRADLELAAWWADFVEIPAVLMGGSDLATLEAAAASGAEFVALSSAVFAQNGREAECVREANRVLDRVHEAGLAA